MTMALSKGSLPLTPETPLLHCCQHTDQAADSARKNSRDKMCLYRCKSAGCQEIPGQHGVMESVWIIATVLGVYAFLYSATIFGLQGTYPCNHFYKMKA